MSFERLHRLEVDRQAVGHESSTSAGKTTGVEASAEQGVESQGGPVYRSSVFGAFPPRKSRDANGVADGAEHAVSAASSSSGAPLPDTLMRKFEGSLGADLSGVRVHTGTQSAAANDAVGARAYTVGIDVHFGAGQYDPHSASGQHLIAHEVAHTVQQSGSAQRMQFKLAVSSPGDAFETEADRAADSMVSGAPASVTFGSGVARKGMRDYNAELDKAANDHANESTYAPVLQATNVNDYASAQNLLTRVEGYRPLMDQAITQSTGGSPLGVMNLPAGVNETKTVTAAKKTNEDLINDLQLYLAAAGGQAIATGSFQLLYGEALRSFYKLDGLMLHLNGSSLNTGNASETNIGVSADKLAGMEVLGTFGAKANVADQVSSIAKADPAGIGSLRTEVKALSKSLRGSLLTDLETKEKFSVLRSKEVRTALLRADGALAKVKAAKLAGQAAAAQKKVSIAGAMATALLGHIAGVGKSLAGKSLEGLDFGDLKKAYVGSSDATPPNIDSNLPQLLGPELVDPMAPSSAGAASGGAASSSKASSSPGPYLAGALAVVTTLDPKAAATAVLATLLDPLKKELSAFSDACGACAGEFPDNTAVLADSEEQIALAKDATAALADVPIREAVFKTSMAAYLGAVQAFTEARELYKAKMEALAAALDQKTGGTSKNGTKSPFTRMLKLITEGELFVVQADAAIKVGEAELADKPKTSATDAHDTLMKVNGLNNAGRPYYEPVVSTITMVDNSTGTPKIVEKKDENGQTVTRVRVQLQTAKIHAQASDNGLGSAEDSNDGQQSTMGATKMSRKALGELRTMRNRVNTYIAKLKAATIGE